MLISDWDVVRLGDFCSKIGSGATPRGGSSAYLPEGPFSLIRSQNVLLNAFSLDGLAFISDEQAAELRNVEVLQHDVLLNITGDSVARACKVDSKVLPARVNQHVAIVRPNPEEIDPRYLLYWLVSPDTQSHLLTMAGGGATRNALTKAMIEGLKIRKPPLPTQQTIASVLSALDDKIELNRRMNETLEAMARALFRSWFVDFDPVRAKSEGRPTGLPADLEALFPNEFEDSPLGEIPKGWQVQPLGHIADVRIGKTPPRLEHHWFSKSRADVRWVSIRDLGRVDVFISETSEFLTADAVSRFRIRVVPDRTVMVSFKLTVGRVAISDGELTTNEAIAHMIPQDSILAPWFLYSYLGTFDYGRLGSTSSIATAVNSDSIRELPVLVPSTGIVRAFNERVESLFQQILVSSRESRALEDMRCDLLPRLLSGEIEVAEAEVAIA